MNYCVIDSNNKVIALYNKSTDAAANCPDGAKISMTHLNKVETQKRIDRRIRLGLQPMIWMKTVEELKELI